MKTYTPNIIGRIFNNNKTKKNGIKKPRTPEIKNMKVKSNKENEEENFNKFNNKNSKRPSTAPHNNLNIKK